ncbi:uncharacterized protein LOC143229842 isoform X2 [Tachypleus tridentatus]|uniref:uncharacterized protein LOC143229842 isoform X2 n=1 Tax=Tachypleus tridentatus TaxID=6853 RepID=UPI003FD48B8B
MPLVKGGYKVLATEVPSTETMTSIQFVSDPYWELEKYLEQAQEEIGKTFDNLKKYENKLVGKESLNVRANENNILCKVEDTTSESNVFIPRLDEQLELGQKLICCPNLKYNDSSSELFYCVPEDTYNYCPDLHIGMHSDDDDEVFYSDNEGDSVFPYKFRHQRFRRLPCSKMTELLTVPSENHKEVIPSPPSCGSVDVLADWADNLVREIDETFSLTAHDANFGLISRPLEILEGECDTHAQRSRNACGNKNFMKQVQSTDPLHYSSQNMCKFRLKYNVRNKCSDNLSVKRRSFSPINQGCSDFLQLRSRRSSCPSWKINNEKTTFTEVLASNFKRTCEAAVQTSDVDYFLQRTTGSDNVKINHPRVKSMSEVGVQACLETDPVSKRETLINRSSVPVQNNIQFKLNLEFPAAASTSTTRMTTTEIDTMKFAPNKAKDVLIRALENDKLLLNSENVDVEGIEKAIASSACFTKVSFPLQNLYIEEEPVGQTRGISNDEKKCQRSQRLEHCKFKNNSRLNKCLDGEFEVTHPSELGFNGIIDKSQKHDTERTFAQNDEVPSLQNNTRNVSSTLMGSKIEISKGKEWKMGKDAKSENDCDVCEDIELRSDIQKPIEELCIFDFRKEETKHAPNRTITPIYSNLDEGSLCDKSKIFPDNMNNQEIFINSIQLCEIERTQNELMKENTNDYSKILEVRNDSTDCKLSSLNNEEGYYSLEETFRKGSTYDKTHEGRHSEEHCELIQFPVFHAKHLGSPSTGSCQVRTGQPRWTNRTHAFPKHYSHHDLKKFLKKVENCAYLPPPPDGRLSSNTDAHKINEQNSEEKALEREFPSHDANTQTTPRSSRSSGYTWAVECDCSEFESLSRTPVSVNISKESFPSFSSSNISEILSDVSSLTDSLDDQSDDDPELGAKYCKFEDNGKVSSSSLSLSAWSFQSEHGSDSLFYCSEESDHCGEKLETNVVPFEGLPVMLKKGEASNISCTKGTGTKPRMDGTQPSNSYDLSGKTYSYSEIHLATVRDMSDNTLQRVSKAHSNLSLPETNQLWKVRKAVEEDCPSMAKQTLSELQETPNTVHPPVLITFSVERKTGKGGKNEQVAQPSTRTKLFLGKMNLKSSSAPVLRAQRNLVGNNNISRALPTAFSFLNYGNYLQNITEKGNKVFTRSQSVKELSELEEIEACNWLKAAGFPQYFQLYKDGLFPIDISSVQEDHKFLDPDSIQALFRRLTTLNKCAKTKVENLPRKSVQSPEESDEEQYALSENWQFQRINHRWSRISSSFEVNTTNQHLRCSSPTGDYFHENQITSSHDSVFVDDHQGSLGSLPRVFLEDSVEQLSSSHLSVPKDEDNFTSGSGESTSVGSEKSSDFSENGIVCFRRSGSERFKDSAKALLRRIESLKGKQKKSHEAIVIRKQHIYSGTASDSSPGSEGDRSSASSLTSSPNLSCHKLSVERNDSSDNQQNTSYFKQRAKCHIARETDFRAFSDSESSSPKLARSWKYANSNISKDGGNEHSTESNSQTKSAFLAADIIRKKERSKHNNENRNTSKSYFKVKYETHLNKNNSAKPVKWFSTDDKRGQEQTTQVNTMTTPTIVFSRTSSVEQATNKLNRIYTDQTRDEHESQKPNCVLHASLPTDDTSLHEEAEKPTRERRDSGVGSSLTRSSLFVRPESQIHWFLSVRRQSSVSIRTVTSHGLHISSLSACQLMKLRKLSLLKLTSLMEKYNPTSRTGWNWGVPNFIRKIRTPDYKDKVVFGVPLFMILQRTGQPLPPSIQVAIRYLRKTAVNTIGLFRKSGVRSRIQKLRNLNDSNSGNVSYENQQAYDVADMLKQYFRELPDALLTNKLSETFISIFQYIPIENRKEAVKAAILLMPDENREVLQSLLAFLQEISQCSDENQMTATNLAVCFAPSLFHLTTHRSSSVSPRRRKTSGVPDQRELNENRAAHECITYMINNYKQLFSIEEENLKLANAEHWEPPTLEELGNLASSRNYNWKTHVELHFQGLQKEARDKFKGWFLVPHSDNIEVSYKKVDDGYPLRLWKVSVDIEAPPLEVLNRVLRERNVWDDSLSKWRVISRLDSHTEIFQHVCNSLGPHPPRDYCVLRSWKSDSLKGSCMLVETSIDHPNVPLLQNSVRGVVLATHFFIEPCGAGKSRLTYMSRVDTRGRSPEWYNKSFGHICALQLIKLRESFKRGTEGPETKV